MTASCYCGGKLQRHRADRPLVCVYSRHRACCGQRKPPRSQLIRLQNDGARLECSVRFKLRSEKEPLESDSDNNTDYSAHCGLSTMSDSRDRHQPIDSYCQLCGDSATWKFTSVSGLNRHCVMMHAHIFTRSGGYRPIPAEHIRIYQDKVRAGRGPTRKARGSLSNSDRHPSWTDYPRLSASVGSPSVADVAQVSVVQVSQPYLPPPPPTLPSPDLVTSRPAAQHADAGGARERYVVVAEDITPDSTST